MKTPDFTHLAVESISAHFREMADLSYDEAERLAQHAARTMFECAAQFSGDPQLQMSREGLAAAWDAGFSACQQRTGEQLLKLIAQRSDAYNPYETS